MLLLGAVARLHAQSPLDGFDPGANAQISGLAVQPDGKILVGGGFTTIGGGGTGKEPRTRMARLHPDGTVDAGFNPGANGGVSNFALQRDGKIIISGAFTAIAGVTRNGIARLHPDGSLDLSFNPDANAAVYALAIQPDGKILIGGQFTAVGGVLRSRIARLHATGTVDATFNPGANDNVFVITVQPDSRILVGGRFSTFGGGGIGLGPRQHIARLYPDGTLDTAFNPGANNDIYALTVQPDGKILLGGLFRWVGGGGLGSTERNYLARVDADGNLDASFNPGANEFVFALKMQSDGKILAAGKFTTLGGGGMGTNTRRYIGRLNLDGTLDANFDPGANEYLWTVAPQEDGKILAVGWFTGLGAGNGATARHHIGRLYPDGTVDKDFVSGANAPVHAMATQPDQRVVIGGPFDTVAGANQPRLARLGADGTRDVNFPGTGSSIFATAIQPDGKVVIAGASFTIFRRLANGSIDPEFSPPTVDSFVHGLLVQRDGRILVWGEFNAIGGNGEQPMLPRKKIARLNPGGSVDADFNPGVNGPVVWSMAEQPDGKFLVGGAFSGVGGGTGITPRTNFARIDADGVVDKNFAVPVDGTVTCIAVQADGSILIGGSFHSVGGSPFPHRSLARVTLTGAVDETFTGRTDGAVSGLGVDTAGRILVGGGFNAMISGSGTAMSRQKIGRFNPDGSIDAGFDPGASNTVFGFAPQADGKIVVNGSFITIGNGGSGSTFRNGIARLAAPEAARQELRVDDDGQTITWRRPAGPLPELQRVTFAVSNNGIDYEPLPDPVRIQGGWRLSNQSLPTHQSLLVRARGSFGSGQKMGSQSAVETIRHVFIAPAPKPTRVVSRKSHSANGSTFDIEVPLAGPTAVECREGGTTGEHHLRLLFAAPVTFHSAAVTAGDGNVTAANTGGEELAVSLSQVANAQTLSVTIFGLSDGTSTGNLVIPIRFLLGDTNGDGSVNSGDLMQTRNRSGEASADMNFRSDLNTDGAVNSGDQLIARRSSGTSVAPSE